MRVSSCRCVCAWPWPPIGPEHEPRPCRRASASAGISVCSGSFPPPSPFGCASSKPERRAAVVEVDAPLVDAQPGARAGEVRLDQADQQPVASRPRTGRSCRRSVRDQASAVEARSGSIDARRRSIQSSASSALAGDRHRVGIADVARCGRRARTSSPRSSRCCAIGAVGAEIETVDDAQRFERGDTLRRRRQLERRRDAANVARSGSTHAPVCAARSSAVMNEPASCSRAAIASPIGPW